MSNPHPPRRVLNPFRAPTAGGQYHWVSEFAPRRYQKFLSYTSGMILRTAPDKMPSFSSLVRLAIDHCLAKFHCHRLLHRRGDDSRHHCSEQHIVFTSTLAGHAFHLRVCDWHVDVQHIRCKAIATGGGHFRGLSRLGFLPRHHSLVGFRP